MSVRRPADRRIDPEPRTDAETPARTLSDAAKVPGYDPIAQPRSLEDAEARYVAARDAWIAAMRAANSGRAVDLASLAIAQESFELASEEVARWRSGATVAIPIRPDVRRTGLEAAIGQEMAWRRVHENQQMQPGPVGRFLRRVTRRSRTD